jgi:hypothetical protein
MTTARALVSEGAVRPLVSSHGLDAPLRAKYGALAMPAGYDRSGRIPSRAAWPCSVCNPCEPHRFQLEIPLDRGGAPARCIRGCSDRAIWRALGVEPRPQSEPSAPPLLLAERGELEEPKEHHPSSGCSRSTRSPTADVPLVPAGRVEFSELGERRLAQRWGGTPDAFPCPVPGHDGAASLVQEEGALLVRCCGGRLRPLGEMRAVEAHGEDVPPIGNTLLATWVRRLAFEVGEFAPLHVVLPALPDGAPSREVAARKGFALLLGLRWADGPRGPVAFSARFAGPWCGLRVMTAHRAIGELVDLGVIRKDGTIIAGGRRTAVYLPGGGA